MSQRQTYFIEAPVEEVFNWFKNPRNWSTLLALNPAAARREELGDVHVSPEGVGTFYSWDMRPLPGLRFQPFVVCTEFVPNKRIVERWSVAFYASYAYSFDPEGKGTRLTLQRHPRSFWRLRALDRLVDRLEGRSNERIMGRLKEVIESAHASTRKSE